jgi:hypothetical protein
MLLCLHINVKAGGESHIIMESNKLYNDGHLIVAAIRVLTHIKGRPPAVADVLSMLAFSTEGGNLICRKLEQRGIIEASEGPYGVRLFIRNAPLLEKIDRDEEGNRLDDALEDFKSRRRDYDSEIAAFKARQKDRKNTVFAEIEKKLKSEMTKP